MLTRLLLLPAAALAFAPAAAQTAQTVAPPWQFFGGFTYLSNTFNGIPGAHQPLTGWEASAGFPTYRHLRFIMDFSDYAGHNLGASQDPYFIMAGWEYERRFHGEGVYVKGLVGEGGINRHWGANAIPGGTASFSTFLGGGLDTPLSRHFAIRVEGGFQHTNFALIESVKDPIPYRPTGLPNYFARISSGLIWYPRVGVVQNTISRTREPHEPVPSELIFEGLSSFGHYHIFAYTWWSYLHVSGVEYDRHSWGDFIGARLDYVAEILPVALLRQPSVTDNFGDYETQRKTTIAGLGISPVGLRMLWRDGKEFKPYYTVKGGMIGFTHKALSKDGSYENFTLQQSIGMQFRVTDRWDFRAGISDFHFSNAFVVPNNPGIDEMAYNAGLSYHLTQRKTAK